MIDFFNLDDVFAYFQCQGPTCHLTKISRTKIVIHFFFLFNFLFRFHWSFGFFSSLFLIRQILTYVYSSGGFTVQTRLILGDEP